MVQLGKKYWSWLADRKQFEVFEDGQWSLSDELDLTPEEAKDYGWTLQPGWALKLSANGGNEPLQKLVTPDMWQFTDLTFGEGGTLADFRAISPEGQTLTRAEWEQLQVPTEEPEVQTEGLELEGFEGVDWDAILRNLYPDQFLPPPAPAEGLELEGITFEEPTVQSVLDFLAKQALETPDLFLQQMVSKGRSPEAEQLINAFFEVQPGDIDRLYAEVKALPVEETPHLLQKALPQRVTVGNLDKWIDYYNAHPGYLKDDLAQVGRNPDTEALAKLVYPDITERGLADYFAPKKEIVEQAIWQSLSTGETITTTEKKARYPKGSEMGLDEWVLTKEASAQFLPVFKVFGQALTKVPKQTSASILQAIQGQSGASVVDRDWADRFIQDAKTDIDKFAQEVGEKYKESPFFIKLTDVAQMPQNIAYSLTSMGAGLGVGVGTALLPIPGARAAAWVTGSAASGAVAYSMTTYQIMQQYLEAKNEESIAKTGRGITLEEENRLKKDFEGKARAYGLYEAVPEAISNLAFGRLLTGPLVKIAGRKIANGIVSKLVTIYGEELLTETITQKGQSAIEAEAGLREGKISWAEAFKEIAPQTFLLTTIMAGAGQVGVSSYQKIKNSLKEEVGEGSPVYQGFDTNIADVIRQITGVVPETARVLGEVRAELAPKEPVKPAPEVTLDNFLNNEIAKELSRINPRMEEIERVLVEEDPTRRRLDIIVRYPETGEQKTLASEWSKLQKQRQQTGTREWQLAKIKEYEAQVATPKEPVTPVTPEVTKEAWQMTQKEYAVKRENQWKATVGKAIKEGRRKPTYGTSSIDAIMARAKKYDREHLKILQQALADGKSIPAEVLKDYPDLTKTIPKEPVTPAEEVTKTFPLVVQNHIADKINTKSGLAARLATFTDNKYADLVKKNKDELQAIWDKEFSSNRGMAISLISEAYRQSKGEKPATPAGAEARAKAEGIPISEEIAAEKGTAIPQLDALIYSVKQLPDKTWQVEIGLYESLGEAGGEILTKDFTYKPTITELEEITDDSLRDSLRELIQKEKGIGFAPGALSSIEESQLEVLRRLYPETETGEGMVTPTQPPPVPVVAEAKEIFTGITEVEEAPIFVAEERVTPPAPPPQPPQTVEVPEPPPSPDARQRVITQSQEVVKQSMPGAINRLFQKIPGIGQIIRWEHPALRAFAENYPHLLVAQVAEVAARSDVAARQVVSRLLLFKQLYDVFGERALRGEKTDIKFVGTEEQSESPITGTLLDIAQSPELYDLTPTQLEALQAINRHNDFSLDYVVNGYGAEIGRFASKPNGAFLSNVDIDEDIIDWLGSESRAIAIGRGKTRYWQTARDRMVADKTFKPQLDIKKLLEGMDSFKASAAGGVTFREIVGGKTRLEAMQETHPKLYDWMISLRKQVQKLQGYKRILTQQQLTALDDFLSSAQEEADLIALDDAFFLRAGRYVAKARAGEMLATIEPQIQALKDQIRELRPAWKVANLKPYVFVQEGLYRYFKPPEAKYIIDSRRTTKNPMLMFIERWRGQAFSGDFSPFAIQGSIGVLADPVGSLKATAGGIKAAIANKDLLHSITIDGLMDDINSDIEGWAEFASLMGRELTGTPREYAAGFLSSIPGFDKFTETTYITVTRGTKNLYDRTWRGLVKNGVPELEAKVAAIEVAQKVYPLVNPAKLGQSQARAAVLRAMPTSYSFIRQPATLIAQASMGYAKLATFQKLTVQERIAVVNITRMATSVLAVSATSAVLSAIAQGKDDDEVWQAFWDAINPDPYNGKFASIIIGDFRIPLGGPYRAIFRAIYPQEVKGIPFPVPFAGIPNYVFNRITPAIKTQINLLRNKDYYGKQIIKGQFPENIIRIVLYEMEGALPLSAGELLSGWRREESWDEIVQQTAAQFVGVNLIKLDNTYFHKLVKNLGLPKQETPSLYSDKIPNFSTKDLYGKVSSVLSDVTLDEIKKRKGYPKLIAEIIAARDLKREVDLLPNYSPVSLKPEDVLGEKGYYAQWRQRQALVDAGNDAEWTVQELVGGKYKTKTLKGEDAVKAFDKEYPQAELGNMSQRQYSLLVQYHAITDTKLKAQFLKDNPEIAINPRTKYLKTHPKENAQLAIWGQAKLLTKEAYTEFKKLVKELDIPDSALPEKMMPPEGSVDNYFKYQDMENKNSWEAQLMLAKDNDLREFLGRQPVGTPIASLELKVKNRELFDQYDALETDKERKQFRVEHLAFVDDTRRIEAIEKGTNEAPTDPKIVDGWVERGRIADKAPGFNAEEKLWLVDNHEVHQWALKNKLLTDDGLDWNVPAMKIDVKYRKEDAEYEALPTTGTARADYLAVNEDYRLDRRRREAYQKGLVDWVEEYVSYYELPVTGYRQERFLFNNPIFAQALGLKVPERVPSEQYDVLLEKDDRTPLDELRMNAYKLYVPDEQVENYVDYKTLPPGVYEVSWFLMENPDFYQQVYLGISGNQPKDFSRVPTRRVFALYEQYDTLPKTGKDRLIFRHNYPDLENWMVKVLGYNPVGDRWQAKEPLPSTPSPPKPKKKGGLPENWQQRLEEMEERLAGLK